MADDAKVRFLFKKIQHPSLQNAIEALKAQQTSGTKVTYTMAANHLSTAVSELPEFLSKNRNISATTTDKVNPAILNSDGTINTGHIPTWRSLPQKDRDIVNNERKARGAKGKSNSPANNGNLNASDANRLKQLTEQNKAYKRKIKALKRANPEPEDSSETEEDAGDKFGGKNQKRNSKKGKKS